MEKVCGYKDNTGKLYGSEQEAEYSNVSRDLDKLLSTVQETLIELSTHSYERSYRSPGCDWETDRSPLAEDIHYVALARKLRLADVEFEPTNGEITDVINKLNMILKYREWLKNINITAEPKPIGIINKIFKKF
jgi:hypothetical protein